MFIATEFPNKAPTPNPEKKSEQEKIIEFLRKEYLKLFYKTFGKPEKTLQSYTNSIRNL